MRRLIYVLTIALLALPAGAVSTSHWTQSNQSDFKLGTLHNVVATNLGDVKLSRLVKTLLQEDPKVSMVTAMAQTSDGVIYAGTAPQGILLKIEDGKIRTAATIDNAVSITALLAEPDGGLLVGVSGAQGRVLRIAKPGDKPAEIFSAKDVQYVWGLARGDDGIIYVATGPNGQLFSVTPDGKQEEIYKSDENNLTSLVSDGKQYLYVGTDPNGRVVQIDRKTKESFVLYNADENEITALALDGDGNLFAATGEVAAQQQQPGQSNEPPKETTGRPEAPATTPLPSQPPNPAKPPPAPSPAPGEPSPIPANTNAARHADWVHDRRSLVVPVALFTYADTAPAPDAGDVPGIPNEPGSEPAAPINSQQTGQANDQKNSENNAKNQQQQEAEQPKGNAIYKIDPNGFVTEVFREDVVIYSMLATHGDLLVGTGDDGEIYQVDPAAQETVVVAKTDAKEVSAMLAAADGQVYMGLSNSGGVVAMTDGYADSGTYTSPVLDATQVSRFGVIQMHGSLPKGTTLTVATRAGNVKDADADGWGAWSAEKDAQEFFRIDSTPARFFQYRITFKTSDAAQTPLINDIDVSYQMPHLAPVIKSIKITDASAAGGASPAAVSGSGGDASAATPDVTAKSDPSKSAGTGTQTINWDSSDIDNDALVYTLYFRAAGSSGPWILLKDKLTDTSYSWDTRGVADGRYRVKVVASDALANPPGEGKSAGRVSEVLVVANTPPVIGDMKTTVDGRSVKIDLRVTDRATTIASMEYSVDSNDVWQSVLPVDRIFDQPEETVSIRINDLSLGEHQIALRATDARGNVGFQTALVTVAGQ